MKKNLLLNLFIMVTYCTQKVDVIKVHNKMLENGTWIALDNPLQVPPDSDYDLQMWEDNTTEILFESERVDLLTRIDSVLKSNKNSIKVHMTDAFFHCLTSYLTLMSKNDTNNKTNNESATGIHQAQLLEALFRSEVEEVSNEYLQVLEHSIETNFTDDSLGNKRNFVATNFYTTDEIVKEFNSLKEMYKNGSLQVKSSLIHQQKMLSKKIDNEFEDIKKILSDKEISDKKTDAGASCSWISQLATLLGVVCVILFLVICFCACRSKTKSGSKGDNQIYLSTTNLVDKDSY